MKRIVLFGAGKSATVLIDYLLEHAPVYQWQLTVADADLELAKAKTRNSPHAVALSFDITDARQRGDCISASDLVISMLPPSLHKLVGLDCLHYGKHLLTASYVDPGLRAMEQQIKERGLLFLSEMGLDPGIDHMSAMELITQIREKGGVITGFLSHCGGLIAPESDDNPWHYKFSWNPRNIVMAGAAGATYLEDGITVHRNYRELFDNAARVEVAGLAPFSCYPNRDSLSYLALYGLQGVDQFIRTTLRHPDFMTAWSHVVRMGLTSEVPSDSPSPTIRHFIDQLIKKNTAFPSYDRYLEGIEDPVERKLVHSMFHWIGFDGAGPLPSHALSPADVTQSILEHKLRLQPGDKDMIVMLHEISYRVDQQDHEIRSSLVVKGIDELHTAMAQTVGLPLAIAAKLILTGKLTLTGLRIPTDPGIYQPVLKELAERGIRFNEAHREL